MSKLFLAVLAMLVVFMPTQSRSAAVLLDEKARKERLEKDAAARAAELAPLYELVELYYRTALDYVPGLAEPLVDYAALDVAAPGCDPRRKPQTHAILVGTGRGLGFGAPVLKGVANDLDLLATLLPQLGVARDNVHVRQDADADRDGVRDAFLKVLSVAGCDDRVLLHFSNRSLRVSDVLTPAALRWANREADAAAFENAGTSLEELATAIATEKPVFVPPQARFVENAFGGRFSDVLLLLDDEVAERHEVMLGRDISDFMVAVRNRGAHAIVGLDILYAAAADLRARQRAAAEDAAWTFEFARDNEADAPRMHTLMPGHGDYAVFYASDAAEMTPELRLPRGDPNARTYGLFSFYFANALAQPMATPRSIAENIRKSYLSESYRKVHPRIDASNPDLALVAESIRAQQGEGAIRILNPTPKRGASVIKRQEIEIQGVVDWPARALGVHIDQQPAALDGTGRFRGTVQLKNGLNRISVVAVTADSRLHPYTLEFVYEGDRKALEGEGRRIAVIIANQSYGSATGFASLSTPFADADALAALLTSKFGFQTEIATAAGARLPLILKDPTKREIEVALHHVGRAVGEKDVVLIFYAGHGVFEPVTSTAYWVPSDAESGFEPSYLSAADISAAIQRMQAGNIILISDSCYSGALLRGGPADAEKIAADQRMQALLALKSRRARVVISSGNNEPVADLGGDGHSIFARALLTGLEKMQHDAFSARELFDDYILQAVVANSDQEPQYRPIEKVGHEGGDFVFVRAQAESAEAR